MKLDNPLLRRAVLYLGEGEWGKADDYCEQVLDQEPENAWAYVIKLMIRLKVEQVEQLGETTIDYEQWYSYRMAYRFADEKLKKQLSTYLEAAKDFERKEEARKLAEQAEKKKAEQERIYKEGLQYASEKASLHELRKAQACFLKIQDVGDAKEKAEDCKKRIAAKEREQQFLKIREYEQEQARKRKKFWIVAGVVACLIALGVWVLCSGNNSGKAEQILNNLSGAEFYGTEIDTVSDQNGSWALVREMTEYSRNMTFHSDGTVSVVTRKFYDREPFITENGKRKWDSQSQYAETMNWSNLKVSFTGKVTVEINGELCELTIDEKNMPISFVMGGVTYQAS